MLRFILVTAMCIAAGTALAFSINAGMEHLNERIMKMNRDGSGNGNMRGYDDEMLIVEVTDKDIGMVSIEGVPYVIEEEIILEINDLPAFGSNDFKNQNIEATIFIVDSTNPEDQADGLLNVELFVSWTYQMHPLQALVLTVVPAFLLFMSVYWCVFGENDDYEDTDGFEIEYSDDTDSDTDSDSDDSESDSEDDNEGTTISFFKSTAKNDSVEASLPQTLSQPLILQV